MIRLAAFFVLLIAAFAAAQPSFAIDLADVANPAPARDLAPYLAGLQTGSAKSRSSGRIRIRPSAPPWS